MILRAMIDTGEHQDNLVQAKEEVVALEHERINVVRQICEPFSRMLTLLDENIAEKPLGTEKGTAQIRMDIIKAVQLHAQLKYDVEIGSSREEDNESSFSFVPHSFIPSKELREAFYQNVPSEKRQALQEVDEETIAQKYREVFGPRRDFIHLLEDYEKYIDRSSSDFVNEQTLLYLLEPTQKFVDTDWGAIVTELRRFVVNANREVLHELIEVGEDRGTKSWVRHTIEQLRATHNQTGLEISKSVLEANYVVGASNSILWRITPNEDDQASMEAATYIKDTRGIDISEATIAKFVESSVLSGKPQIWFNDLYSSRLVGVEVDMLPEEYSLRAVITQ